MKGIKRKLFRSNRPHIFLLLQFLFLFFSFVGIGVVGGVVVGTYQNQWVSWVILLLNELILSTQTTIGKITHIILYSAHMLCSYYVRTSVLLLNITNIYIHCVN